MRLPLTFEYTDKKLICTEGEFSGSIVLSIGGISTDDLYIMFKNSSSYELVEFLDFDFANRCRNKAYLAFLNVDISKPIEIVFHTSKGEVSALYEFAEPKQDQENKFVSYIIDKENSVGIFTLNECRFNKTYKETLNSFFTEIKANNIKTVIVDLRKNGGGDSRVADRFIQYLNVDQYIGYGDTHIRKRSILWKFKSRTTVNEKIEDLLFCGDLYVLTSKNTFSSATMFATKISDNGIGKIVGEISGGKPTSYSDTTVFQTPNSRLLFNISWKLFHRPDRSKDDLPLIPDYPSSAEDALKTAYEVIAREI